MEQTLMLGVHQEIEVAKEIRTQQRLVHICDDELPRVTAIVELQREFAFAKCADGSAVSCRSRGAEPGT